MRTTLTRWLVVGALAGFGILAGSQISSAQTPSPATSSNAGNESENATSESGGTTASNNASAQAGPQSQGSGEAQDIEGPTSATVVQEGDNEVNVSQHAEARSGDAVAGSQVTGIVNSGGTTTVRQSNSSKDAEARSGDATASNFASVSAGPSVIGDCGADTADIEGPTAACIVQEGDNEVDVSQSSVAVTGDSVAGSQVLGIVNTGGDVSVDNTNESEDADSESGEADASNDIFATAGPTVVGEGGGTATGDAVGGEAVPVAGGLRGVPGLITGPSAADITGGTTAIIVHEGDNQVDADQNSGATTGDAVAGAQIQGLVNSEGGSISVVSKQSSDDPTAESGEATSSNGQTAIAGPIVADTLVVGDFGPDDIEDVTADIVHEGDNDVDSVQNAAASTGDAVAGAQVFGVVGSGGATSIDATNDSEDADATSGDATADNDSAVAFAGPIVADTVFVGDFGPDDIEDVGPAGIVHEGDNDTSLDQDATASSGDAVAGGQVFGVVGSGDTSIVASNKSEDDEAESGEATADNDSAATAAGPIFTLGGVQIVEFTGKDITDVGAVIVHEGDNDTSLDQSGTAGTGDAVAGAQIMGVVTEAGGSVAIDATNDSEDAESESGDATADNGSAAAFAGPILAGRGQIILGEFTPADIEDVTAGIVHEGDNDTSLDQSAAAASGDAVAGGQVFGVVGSGDTSIVASNTSEDDEATSGDATADNDSAAAVAGPLVGTQVGVGEFEFSGTDIEDVAATIVHEGDNDTDLSQLAGATTGDAVAGAQIMGVVTTSGSVAIDATNVSEDSESESGDAEASNDTGAAFAGPIVAGEVLLGDFSGTDIENAGAAIIHEGDNDLELGQSAGATTGDAVAGGQVLGVVSGGDVSIVASNDSEDAEATSGDTTLDNSVATAVAGPIHADAVFLGDFGSADITDADGVIIHEGDNDLSLDQSLAGTSGDAVAGGQVMGVVASGGSVAIDATNVSEDSESESGSVDGSNDVGAAVVGPIVADSVSLGASDITNADGDIIHEGDNDFEINQSLSLDSGDAVAGGQIIGVVASGGIVDIVQDNDSEDDESESGEANGDNNLPFSLTGPLVADTVIFGGLLP